MRTEYDEGRKYLVLFVTVLIKVVMLCPGRRRKNRGGGAQTTKGLRPDRGPGVGGGLCPVAAAGR